MRREIRRGKDTYRRKLEERLQRNNAREVWRGLKNISGHSKTGSSGPEARDREWANKLNLFFNQFDSAAPTSSQDLAHKSPVQSVTPACATSLHHSEVTHHSPRPLSISISSSTLHSTSSLPHSLRACLPSLWGSHHPPQPPHEGEEGYGS